MVSDKSYITFYYHYKVSRRFAWFLSKPKNAQDQAVRAQSVKGRHTTDFAGVETVGERDANLSFKVQAIHVVAASPRTTPTMPHGRPHKENTNAHL